MSERLPIFESVVADFRDGRLGGGTLDSHRPEHGKHGWKPSPQPRDEPTEPLPPLSEILSWGDDHRG